MPVNQCQIFELLRCFTFRVIFLFYVILGVFVFYSHYGDSISSEKLNSIRSRLFYCVKVQGVFRDPPKTLGTIEGNPMKLCRVMVLLKVYQNTKRNFQRLLM